MRAVRSARALSSNAAATVAGSVDALSGYPRLAPRQQRLQRPCRSGIIAMKCGMIADWDTFGNLTPLTVLEVRACSCAARAQRRAVRAAAAAAARCGSEIVRCYSDGGGQLRARCLRLAPRAFSRTRLTPPPPPPARLTGPALPGCASENGGGGRLRRAAGREW